MNNQEAEKLLDEIHSEMEEAISSIKSEVDYHMKPLMDKVFKLSCAVVDGLDSEDKDSEEEK